MTFALIGAGAMGEGILAGVLRGGVAGDSVRVVEHRAERAAELAERYGVQVVDSVTAAQAADELALVVKPKDAAGVLAEIGPHLRPGTLLISFVAGLTTATIEAALPGDTPVVRVMPNTPAMYGQGMAAASAGSHAQPAHLDRVRELLAGTGAVVVVPESQQDAVTAVSGSGPAYIFLVAEAMIEAGVQLGLARDVATTLTNQTILGAATMLTESADSATVLRERVTSPGGTTAAALRMLEAHSLRAAFSDAIEASYEKSRALG
ncbi:pyrroline-5-carboxylate reductase [Granulicoccus phenolivorans]|uniref:pyrroline-5-carboxylate reductase n=1 Tax=Granulicoccus phenolivorans TaxID=266854 RepID=UPI00041D436E|nr:pyrroline-5-carboxylate reductase [Granulicoccus phenolivorans]